jgi:hypothetical protein
MKTIISVLAIIIVMVISLSGTALAAAPEPAEQATETPPSIELYPHEVIVSRQEGMPYIEKVYTLTAADDPSQIPTDSFERGGFSYAIVDMLKKDNTTEERKQHSETISIESVTNDMEQILLMLEPKWQFSTEDGFSGTLSLDHTTIEVEAAGYSNRSYTVSATRTYPNLSDADLSLVPKTVEENGRTLTLADVDWQSDQSGGTLRYNATASYTGKASSKTATGYIVTAKYHGELVKTSCDEVIYTAVFIGKPLEPATNAGDAAEFPYHAIGIVGIILLLFGAILYFASRKRGRKSW